MPWHEQGNFSVSVIECILQDGDFNFQTFLQNFISIYIIFKKSLQSLGQNWGGFGHSCGPVLEYNVLNFNTSCCTTSHPYLPYPQILEEFVQWLSRSRPDKIQM